MCIFQQNLLGKHFCEVLSKVFQAENEILIKVEAIVQQLMNRVCAKAHLFPSCLKLLKFVYTSLEVSFLKKFPVNLDIRKRKRVIFSVSKETNDISCFDSYS